MIRGTHHAMAQARRNGASYAAIAAFYNMTIERAYIYTRACLRDFKEAK